MTWKTEEGTVRRFRTVIQRRYCTPTACWLYTHFSCLPEEITDGSFSEISMGPTVGAVGIRADGNPLICQAVSVALRYPAKMNLVNDWQAPWHR
jgi:hypothetical protein